MWGCLRTYGGMDKVHADAVETVQKEATGLPAGFDVQAWTQAACEASGVPFGVEDPVVLGRLRTLMEHPA